MRDAPRDEDVVELGGHGLGRRLFGDRFRLPDGRGPSPGWRPSRGAAAFAVTSLAVGLVAGYTAGDWHGRRGTVLPEPTPAAVSSAAAASAASASAASASAAAAAASAAASFPFAASSALVQDPGGCSMQSGRHLELGVQVVNMSMVPVTLRSAKAVLPLGGLTGGSWNWAPCGALPQTLAGQADQILQPGASTWLTMTFSVKVGCPAPLPVQFTIGYLAAGRSFTASAGFPDLGQVPYTGCPPESAAAAGGQFVTEADA